MKKREEDFEISLINQPVEPIDVESPPLTAREIADRRWRMEGRKEPNK